MPNQPDFVSLTSFDPRLIITSHYAGETNFVGRPIIGYSSLNKAMLTRKAADALSKAQDIFEEDGYRIVIYDAYRPSKAVKVFFEWSQDHDDCLMRDWFYPHIDKKTLFDLGFLARRSTHSRGGAIDMSIIKDTSSITDFAPSKRTLNDGTEFTFLRDGTADMGTHFDYFGNASYTDDTTIPIKAIQNRQYLRKVMHQCGFKNFYKEWWHFTFQNETYPDQYFDFDVN